MDAQVATPKLYVRLGARLKRAAGGVAHKFSHFGRHSTRLKLAQKAPARAAHPTALGTEKRLSSPVAHDDRVLASEMSREAEQRRLRVGHPTLAPLPRMG